MIFVTVGSQLTFDRLLKTIDKEIEIGNIKDKVIVQGGKTKYKSKYMTIIKYLDLDEFENSGYEELFNNNEFDPEIGGK